MEVPIVKIRNSKGIRLNKTLLEKYNIKDSVEIVLGKNQIVIKPLDKPRKGWEKAYEEMADNEEDRLLFDDVFQDENLEEWK